jgi:hypothetical protein
MRKCSGRRPVSAITLSSKIAVSSLDPGQDRAVLKAPGFQYLHAGPQAGVGHPEPRLHMEHRHPADSRLAVQWVERFEAYYRIWTPAYALAANLEAAVKTRRDEPAEHLPWDPDSAEPYDPLDQADGYGRYALYAYAQFQLEVKKFMTRHGGLWLLSDVDVEQQVADAVYRIGWHNRLIRIEGVVVV